jgi:hypothetical protein
MISAIQFMHKNPPKQNQNIKSENATQQVKKKHKMANDETSRRPLSPCV